MLDTGCDERRNLPRVELVCSSEDIASILSIRPDIVMEEVKQRYLLVKIPRDHVGDYAKRLLQDLIKPL